jgi:hypothetical protein
MSEKRGETFVMKGEGAAPKGLDFSSFLMGMASSALIHLGLHQNPETGQSAVDLEQAKQTLDLLGLLREKTRGNLTPDEERLFESLLAELRIRFVEVSRK